MDYSKEYQEKLISAKDAAKMVKDNMWIDYAWCVQTPTKLLSIAVVTEMAIILTKD